MKPNATLLRFFNWLLFSSTFITLCTLGLVLQAVKQLNIPELQWAYFLFAAGGTLASYNLHGYFTTVKPADHFSSRHLWLEQNRNILLPLSMLGLILAAFAITYLYQHWLGVMISVVWAFLYTAPKISFKGSRFFKKIAFAKTTYLALAWTYVTCILPIFITHISLDKRSALFILHRFFFIYSLCIAFDYRDKEADRSEGIRSLITWLDDRKLIKVYYCTLALAGISGMAFSYISYAVPTTGLLLCIPLVILALFSKWIFRQKNDYVYYFLLDGLMLLSFLLTHLLDN